MLQGLAHGIEQRAAILHFDELDELHQHLGVCLGVEVHPVLLQSILQYFEILYRAVVHQRQIAILAEMRVCVGVVGLAVSCPAGMRYAQTRIGRFVATETLKRRHFAAGLVNVDFIIGSK